MLHVYLSVSAKIPIVGCMNPKNRPMSFLDQVLLSKIGITCEVLPCANSHLLLRSKKMINYSA